MATANRAHEQTINVALGEVLEALGRAWAVRSEEPGALEGGGRLDVLVEKRDGWPVVIEAEVGNHHQAEVEAQSRLGRRLAATGHTIHAAVALVYPDALRKFSGAALRNAISTTAFEFALYSTAADGSTERFPQSGWLAGGVTSVAVLLHRSSIPAWRVEALATALETGVKRTEGALSAAHPIGSPLGVSIGNLLGQSDDAGHQTRRMAMTVVVDALVFHAALAEAQMQVRDLATSQQRPVQAPSVFRSGGAFLPSRVLDEWESILEVNYWPIFHTAKEVIGRLPPQMQVTILGLLWATAEELVAGGVTKSHDLTGIVFQRLIADRKFLATYYTRPSAAALLVGLALPLDRPIRGSAWADVDALGSTRVADFACGTGTLLSTAYQRLALLHEVHGGDPRALHPQMMAHGLVGLDVLTVAVHLTAAMLAGSFPDVPFAGECLLTMPYGSYAWGPCVGSLELLEEQIPLSIIETAAQTAGGRGANDVTDLVHRIGHGQFDLVIMNPPFTRHGAREGERTEVHNPAFAAFGADDALQDQLSNRLKHLSRDGSGHGHAGLASYFVDLADRKIMDGGNVGLGPAPVCAQRGFLGERAQALARQVLVASGRHHCRAGVGTAVLLGRHRHRRMPDRGDEGTTSRSRESGNLRGPQGSTD